MTVKEISYQELEAAIRVSFEGDSDILKMYDPRISITCIEDIVQDITRKIKTYDHAQLRGVFDKNRLVGYFVRGSGMLISFALCVKLRVRNYKREFFSIIKQDFKGMFVCLLWSTNVRGIRFLEKNGMKVIGYDEKITKLIYKKD